MKKVKILGLAFLVASLLAIPAMAQKTHGNSGPKKQTGQARAEEVQNPNGDKDRKGGRKKQTRTRKGWEKGVAEHRAKAKGHSK